MLSLVLLSSSPRRKSILESLGIPFRIEIPNVDEKTEGKNPSDLVLQNAELKLSSTLNTLSNSEIGIVADTIVYLKGEVLGKPADAGEARQMLQKLSGQTHQVFTGISLFWNKQRWSKAFQSDVTFHRLSPERIEKYLKTREPFDKAGSYAIQGVGTVLIQSIEGSYTNVMGLPLEGLLEGLGELSGGDILDWWK